VFEGGRVFIVRVSGQKFTREFLSGLCKS
jgi:hypothetical protein